jgi:hypothetical protein
MSIDVEHDPGTSQPYLILPANPFVNNPDCLPENQARNLYVAAIFNSDIDQIVDTEP